MFRSGLETPYPGRGSLIPYRPFSSVWFALATPVDEMTGNHDGAVACDLLFLDPEASPQWGTVATRTTGRFQVPKESGSWPRDASLPGLSPVLMGNKNHACHVTTLCN